MQSISSVNLQVTLLTDTCDHGSVCCIGKQGVFVGKDDAHFAILANSGDKIDIYATPSPVAPGSKPSKKLDAAPKPMRSLNLPTISTIFAGPAWGCLPR